MQKKKLLITVGGTGGHVYPSLAVAKELQNDCEIHFIGGKLAQNRYFESEKMPYTSIPCGTLSGKNPVRLFKDALAILNGIRHSIVTIKRFQPDLILGFGSYHTLPVLIAAKLLRIPIILHEANSVPGKVNRLMARSAKVTGIHFPEAARHLKGATVEVEMPLRAGFCPQKGGKEKALHFYGLDAALPTLLIFGGSQGAKAINHLFIDAVKLMDFRKFQVIHLIGSNETADAFISHYQALGIKAVVKEFEEQMNMAWQAADLLVSRSGASTIAEQLAFEVPGILIPYPYATDRHQDKNAEFMVNIVKGAVMQQEKELTAKKLAEILENFLSQKNLFLHQKRNSIITYKQQKTFPSLKELIKKQLS